VNVSAAHVQEMIRGQKETRQAVDRVHQRLDGLEERLEDRCRKAHERIAALEVRTNGVNARADWREGRRRDWVRFAAIAVIAAVGWVVAWFKK